MDEIACSKSAFDYLAGLPAEVREHYQNLIFALPDDPYGGRRFPTADNSVYDRVLDTGAGWIRYQVRRLTKPEIKVLEMHWNGAL